MCLFFSRVKVSVAFCVSSRSTKISPVLHVLVFLKKNAISTMKLYYFMFQVPAIYEKRQKLWQITVKENVVSVRLVVAEQAEQRTHECFQSSIYFHMQMTSKQNTNQIIWALSRIRNSAFNSNVSHKLCGYSVFKMSWSCSHNFSLCDVMFRTRLSVLFHKTWSQSSEPSTDQLRFTHSKIP